MRAPLESYFTEEANKPGVGKPAGAAGAARRQLQVSQAGRALKILKYYMVGERAGFDNRL